MITDKGGRQPDGSRQMILVLGMHRSGTSAVAGTLAQLGVDFSERLIAASEDNPKGYFEHAEIWQQNHELLQAMGSTWDDTLPLPGDWQQIESVGRMHARVQAILKRDFGSAELAGIKDPRMCRFVPLWRDWLTREGFLPRAVLAIRRPAEVIASLAKRDQLSAEHAAWVWLRHVLESELATRGLPRVVLCYERLLQDWRAEIARMDLALGLDLSREAPAAGLAIDMFLEPTLRHYRSEEKPLSIDHPLRGWVESAYAALTGGDTIDLAQLDRISVELAELDKVGAASAALLRAARRRSVRLERDLAWCDGERLGLVAGNRDLRENLGRHIDELERAKQGNLDLRENLDRHVDELERVKQGNEYLRSEVAGLSRQVSRVAAELTVVAAEREKTSAELAMVYASRSWRLTRPLRGAIRVGRRVLGRSMPAAPHTVTATTPQLPLGENAVERIEDPATILQAAIAAASGPRVLIVTPDIMGPIRNGGIGTAFGALAQTLAQAGRAVTILYTLGGHSEDGGGIAQWERHYASLGIRFLPIWLEQGEPVLDAPHHAWRAYRVYLWLKQHQADYDLAYFPEWKGEAYFALQAKRLALDFAGLQMIVVTHSSTAWAESGNYQVPKQFDDLLLEFLERRSTEMADVVISPSQYMIGWMKSQGWDWSAPTHVIQNLMPDAPVHPQTADAPAFTITEWVFFGRLERRKGLLVFLDALRLVPAELRERIQVTFLGKSIRTPEFDSAAAIRERLADWP